MDDAAKIREHYSKMFERNVMPVNSPPKTMAIAASSDRPESGGYIQGYHGEDTSKRGLELIATDVIQLDAPEVFLSPDTPLKTKAQDVAGAINELYERGGSVEPFTALSDTGSAISIM